MLGLARSASGGVDDSYQVVNAMTREELQELLDKHDQEFGKPEDPLAKWKREADERGANRARAREGAPRARACPRHAERESAEELGSVLSSS